MIIKAHTKINLMLHITGKLQNNMHLIESLIAFTSLHDLIDIAKSETTEIQWQGRYSQDIPRDNNTMLSAIKSIEQHTDRTINVQVKATKNIPLGSGLGGGSADAAAIIHAINHIFALGLSMDDMLKIASSVGSDVVICVRGTASMARNTGNYLSPIPPFPNMPVVLIYPNIQLTAKQIYQSHQFKYKPNISVPDHDIINHFHQMDNDLYYSAIKIAPEIANIIETTKNIDKCSFAAMSGSGSTCFGIFEDEASALAAKKTLQSAFPKYQVFYEQIIHSAQQLEPTETQPITE